MNKCLQCGNDVKIKFCNKTCVNLYYWKRPEYSKKMKVLNKGRVHYGIARSNIQRAQAKRAVEKPESYGKNIYKSGHFVSKKNNRELYYQSSYELLAFEILEQQISVYAYEKCKFSIDYMSPVDGFLHKYIPDILVTYVDGRKQIIEIKPIRLLSNEIVKAKASAAQEKFGNKYAIWTQKDLGLMN